VPKGAGCVAGVLGMRDRRNSSARTLPAFACDIKVKTAFNLQIPVQNRLPLS
jgi:hypothetical protein